MTLIAESIKSLIEKKDLLKSLEKDIKELTNLLIAEHKKSGKDVITESGYQSKISHACRKTPLVPAIEALLGQQLPADCFKLTEYDSVRTECTLLNESK